MQAFRSLFFFVIATCGLAFSGVCDLLAEPAAVASNTQATQNGAKTSDVSAANPKPGAQARGRAIAHPAGHVKAPSRSEGFANIVEPLLPAVVNVSVIKRVTTYSLEMGPKSNQGPGQDLFRFRDFLEQFEFAPKRRRVPVGAGSGFIIDPEGYVVTNAHVVDGADEVMVTLSDQRELKAKVVGSDPRTDLALLKVKDASPLPFVRFGDASRVRVGNWAIVVGNALGLGGTVTVGVISHVGRSFAAQPSHVGGFFQTDAPINLGNSGGPLFDISGQVIGINMMIASPTGANIGIGFAIPSDVAQFVIGQLRKYGYVKRGWLGVHIQDLTPGLARTLRQKAPVGALISNTVPDGPAARAGLKEGDLILEINDVPIRNAAQTTKVVGGVPIGSTVRLKVWRRNPITKKYSTQVIKVLVEENKDISKPKAIKEQEAPETQKAVALYGLTLKEIDAETRKKLRLEAKVQGLLITGVHPESKASEYFKPGDIVLEISNMPARKISEAKTLLKVAHRAGEECVLFRIRREGISFFAPLNLDDDLGKEKNK